MKATLGSIERWVDSVYPNKELLAKRLQSGEKLKVYLGIDPTSEKIHIGHSVPLRLLRKLQDAGHHVILLIGDFTAMIGDPSGRDKQREPLTRNQIAKNYEQYQNQAKKILDFKNNPPKIAYNSSWWEKLGLSDFISLASKFTLSQLSERDLFQERIKKGNPIAISELLYPILQGYDSVELDVDIEIGATDQTFNMLVGRGLLKSEKNKEKIVITTPLLKGADGRKMGKTYGNAIDIDSGPVTLYGKLMSITDEMVPSYLRLTTNLEERDLDKIVNDLKPMDAKKRLAFEIVKEYRGVKDARFAESEFERVVQKGEPPKTKIKIIEKSKKLTALETLLFLEMVQSKSEAKRLIEQSGVSINGKRVRSKDEKFDLVTGTVAQIGKLKAIEVKISG